MTAEAPAIGDITSPPAPSAGKPASAAGVGTKVSTLDDVMIAMDVVDTMRHRDDLVRRELDDDRDEKLLIRLREIYRQQGIEVPDHVLLEGVKALKESRFTYTQTADGWQRRLFTLWTQRRRWGAMAGVAATALLGTCGYTYVTETRPLRMAEEKARIEITEILPRDIRRSHTDIKGLTKEADPLKRADVLLADGDRAQRDGDRARLLAARTALGDLARDLSQEYTLTIVSRPGETSGVWRVPPKNPNAKNYYLVVEAITADGKRLALATRNEETGVIDTVEKFAVRVPKESFDKVALDKRDDGIIQNNKFAVKTRGTTRLDYLMPADGGTITKW
jgi:Family of unknown function (DUF6384)